MADAAPHARCIPKGYSSCDSALSKITRKSILQSRADLTGLTVDIELHGKDEDNECQSHVLKKKNPHREYLREQKLTA
jgi:hypothetical protein